MIEKMMLLTFSLLLIAFLLVSGFTRRTEFGRAPRGARLERIKKSPHYKNGAFQNLSKTPVMAEDSHFLKVISESLFSKKIRNKPLDSIPSVKSDLLHLSPTEDVLVWFGHSSYFMQVDGKKILVDPVFSKAASPLSFMVNAFPGANRYTPDDMPAIDYLFISHDHWDHLDYETVRKLKTKVRKVVCGLGVGEYFEAWGYAPESILEGDWNESVTPDPGFQITFAPARHFSGRSFKRNQTLWTAFVLKTPHTNLFLGGDGGYDTHLAAIGTKYGPFDLAILENGQYNNHWRYIHMLPEQVIQAAKDLNAHRIFPVHSSKFALAMHPWDEPLVLLSRNAALAGIPLVTPIIGEIVELRDTTRVFAAWWTHIH